MVFVIIIEVIMNKYFIIVPVACLIVSFIVFFAWWSSFVRLNNQTEEELGSRQEILPVVKSGENTTVFGVEMQNKCFAQFQDFVKTNGGDYSKCLVDFNFNEQDCGGLDPETQGLFDVNIIVILDSSGSMVEKIGTENLASQAKIDIAKMAVSNFLTKMPQGVKTGLLVYGHKGSNSIDNKNLSCQGVEEIVKLGRNNYDNIITAVNSFSPKGWTPIAGSFDFAKNIFKNAGNSNKNYLILVSDGAESCDGDPLASATNIKLEVPGIKLIVIGFATDEVTRDLLKKVAVQGNGSYLSANNSSDIAEAFNKQLLIIKKDCLQATSFKAYFMNNNNNINNLDCWLKANKKESDDFIVKQLDRFFDKECNLEISEALRARHTDFWYKKEILTEKNNAIYKKIETNFSNQLKELENLKK